MKHRLATATSALFGLLLLLSSGCKPDSSKQQTREAVDKVVPPKQLISLETAREYYQNYGTRRVPLIRRYEDSVTRATDPEGKPFDVARYVSFDYEVLKAYLAYIEQEAARVNTDIESLRIYFATYPDAAGRTHPRQNSVFLLPAVEMEEKQWGLFIDGDRPGYLNGSLEVHQGPARAEASMVPAPPQQGRGGSLILNEGQSSPPPYQ
jgi:hypothetical protein